MVWMGGSQWDTYGLYPPLFRPLGFLGRSFGGEETLALHWSIARNMINFFVYNIFNLQLFPTTFFSSFFISLIRLLELGHNAAGSLHSEHFFVVEKAIHKF
jgi:hypothetical protein